MKFLFLGAGAIGTYVGGSLAAAVAPPATPPTIRTFIFSIPSEKPV